MFSIKGFFGNTQNIEQTKAAFLESQGQLGKVADRLNIGARAQLKNALANLEKCPTDPKALETFYKAFNARAKNVNTESSRIEVLRALLGKDAKSILPELAKLFIKEEANSQEVLSMDYSEVPEHLSGKIKELAPMFSGLMKTRVATHQLIPVAAAAFETNGFYNHLENEEIASIKAGSPDNKAAQVAMRQAAKRDGLHASYQKLTDESYKYSSSGSQCAASVAKNNAMANERFLRAVTWLEQSGVSSVALLTKHIEGLMAAMEKSPQLSLGTLSKEFSLLRNDLNTLLKALEKDSFTIEDVRGFIKASDRALSKLEIMLDNKTGVFSAMDATQFFRVLGSERSQVEKGVILLKREVHAMKKQVQSFDYFIASAKGQEAMRKRAHQNVEALRGQVAKEEKFFKLSEKKQLQQIQSQYESELNARLSVIKNVKSFLDVPTTKETLVSITKTGLKMIAGAAALVAVGAIAYNHSAAVKESVAKGLSYMPASVVGGITSVARPLLNQETAAVNALLPHFDKAKAAATSLYGEVMAKLFPAPQSRLNVNGTACTW